MPEPTIISLLREAKRPLLSFEFFPPKEDGAFERLRKTVAALCEARPDFGTVTYGAGGSTQHRTLEVCRLLRDTGLRLVMPHLTCVRSSRNELDDIVDTYYAEGYRNIMALRGDPPAGQKKYRPHPHGLPYARDLVERIKVRHEDICCGVAGYPETHPEAVSPAADIENVYRKISAGGSFVTTQLFYENRSYFDFVETCRANGMNAPIIPGLLPAVSLKQVRRITSMCGSVLPDALARDLEAAGDDEKTASKAGIRWIGQQMDELLDRGVPGIHLYILNRSRTGLAPAIMGPFNRFRS